MNTLVYVGLGANKGPAFENIQSAYNALRKSEGISQVKHSSIYETPPIGPEQPNYLNSVASFYFDSTAEKLLQILQSIEAARGRNRAEEVKWGPRSLDLDILLFGHQELNTKTLKIPHPEMLKRAFVLTPLLELAPSLTFGNTSIQQLAHQLHDSRIKKRFSTNGDPI